MTATNLRYFWMLQRKTDYVKRNSASESANMKLKGKLLDNFCIVSLPSTVFPLSVAEQEQVNSLEGSSDRALLQR